MAAGRSSLLLLQQLLLLLLPGRIWVFVVGGLRPSLRDSFAFSCCCLLGRFAWDSCFQLCSVFQREQRQQLRLQQRLNQQVAAALPAPLAATTTTTTTSSITGARKKQTAAFGFGLGAAISPFRRLALRSSCEMLKSAAAAAAIAAAAAAAAVGIPLDISGVVRCRFDSLFSVADPHRVLLHSLLMISVVAALLFSCLYSSVFNPYLNIIAYSVAAAVSGISFPSWETGRLWRRQLAAGCGSISVLPLSFAACALQRDRLLQQEEQEQQQEEQQGVFSLPVCVVCL